MILSALKKFRDHTLFFRYALHRLFRGNRSYSENGEDLKVQELLGKVRWFIDIGGGSSWRGSNIFYFALRGAQGVCFEPLPEYFVRLRSLYLFNPRVQCRNCGISDEERDSEFISWGAWSYIPETEDRDHTKLFPGKASAKKALQIKLLRFENAIKGIPVPPVVDLLSIDVEGHELNVLRSIPFDRYAFRLIVLETHEQSEDGKTVWRHRDFDQMFQLLEQNGYTSVFSNRVNTFFVPSPQLLNSRS